MHFTFCKSNRKNKKYSVYVHELNKTIHFGDLRYQHYEDKTPLQLYKYLNHYDIRRRELFKKRHDKTRHKMYSPSWFSDIYLW